MADTRTHAPSRTICVRALTHRRSALCLHRSLLGSTGRTPIGIAVASAMWFSSYYFGRDICTVEFAQQVHFPTSISLRQAIRQSYPDHPLLTRFELTSPQTDTLALQYGINKIGQVQRDLPFTKSFLEQHFHPKHFEAMRDGNTRLLRQQQQHQQQQSKPQNTTQQITMPLQQQQAHQQGQEQEQEHHHPQVAPLLPFTGSSTVDSSSDSPFDDAIPSSSSPPSTLVSRAVQHVTDHSGPQTIVVNHSTSSRIDHRQRSNRNESNSSIFDELIGYDEYDYTSQHAQGDRHSSRPNRPAPRNPPSNPNHSPTVTPTNPRGANREPVEQAPPKLPPTLRVRRNAYGDEELIESAFTNRQD